MEPNYLLQEEVMRLRSPTTGARAFRESLEKIGEYLAIQIAPKLDHSKWNIKTPMGETAEHDVLDGKLALIGVLRAGLPLYNGLLNALPSAESGFIGAARDEKTLQSKITYSALPELGGKNVIIADTMLATGGTMCDVLDEIEQYNPKKIILASAIASSPGIERVITHKIEKGGAPLLLYAAAIDEKLNEKGYILPGLGDAGDRCFGRTV